MLVVNTEDGKLTELVASGTPNEICGDVALTINEIWKGMKTGYKEFFKARITELLIHPKTPMWEGSGPAVLLDDDAEASNREMQIYEAILEKYGDFEAMSILADAVGGFSEMSAKLVVNFLASGCENSFPPEEVKAELRQKLAAVQIACDLMSLVVGDTAAEECDFLETLEKRIQDPQDPAE